MIECMLLSLEHPEMPNKKPLFHLHVQGKEDWSWADIEPNWKFSDAGKFGPSPVSAYMKLQAKIKFLEEKLDESKLEIVRLAANQR